MEYKYMPKNTDKDSKTSEYRKLFTFSGNSELLLDLLNENGHSRKVASVVNQILNEAMRAGLYRGALSNMLKPEDAKKIISLLDKEFDGGTEMIESSISKPSQTATPQTGVSKAFKK
jgi:hypothetical protein